MSTYHTNFHHSERFEASQGPFGGGSPAHQTKFSPIASPKPSCIDEYRPHMMSADPVTRDFEIISLAPNASDIPKLQSKRVLFKAKNYLNTKYRMNQPHENSKRSTKRQVVL
jgi:hypothetical protein